MMAKSVFTSLKAIDSILRRAMFIDKVRNGLSDEMLSKLVTLATLG